MTVKRNIFRYIMKPKPQETIPDWRLPLFQQLAVGVPLAEVAMELGRTVDELRGLMDSDADLRSAVETARARLHGSYEDWAGGVQARCRRAIEVQVTAGNVTLVSALLRAGGTLTAGGFPALPLLSADPADDGGPPGANRRLAEWLADLDNRDLARWWWLEVRAGTPEPARRLLPEEVPDIIEQSLRQLLNDDEDDVDVRATALEAALASFARPQAADETLHPHVHGHHRRQGRFEEDCAGHPLHDDVEALREYRTRLRGTGSPPLPPPANANGKIAPAVPENGNARRRD